MSDLPDPDSPAFRLLVIRGRQQAVQEATHAFHQSFGDIDSDAPMHELAAAYASRVTEHGLWLFEQLREVSSELDLIAGELGIDLPDPE